MRLNRLSSFLLALFTAITNWIAFYLIALKFKSAIPFEIASMLTFGLVIHEVGHKIAMEYYGIRTHLIFLVILGGASPDKRDNKTFENLHYNKKSVIYFAGVIGNFIAILFGIVLANTNLISDDLAMRNMNINAILIFYNIFPIWITDGGRWSKLFFNSTPEHLDFGWIFKIGIPIAMAAIYYSIITPETFLFTGPLMLWGLHFQATHDDPNGCYSPLALSIPAILLGNILFVIVYYFYVSTWYLTKLDVIKLMITKNSCLNFLREFFYY